MYFKGSAAQKVVLLISILEHAASLFRVACACNSSGVRGWGCCSGPRVPVARFGVWRRPCAARLLTFFLQRKTTLLPLKYLPACAVFGVAGLRRPRWRPSCPAHAATQKKGGSLFNSDHKTIHFRIPIDRAISAQARRFEAGPPFQSDERAVSRMWAGAQKGRPAHETCHCCLLFTIQHVSEKSYSRL